MGQFNKVTVAVLFLGLITLCGCQDLVPRDTLSLLSPKFRRSEIFGFCGGSRNDLCRSAGPDSDAKASVKCWHEPEDGGNHGNLSNPLGLLRLPDRFATGDRMEHRRGVDQFPECRRVQLFCL